MILAPFLPMLAVRSEPFDSAEYLFEGTFSNEPISVLKGWTIEG